MADTDFMQKDTVIQNRVVHLRLQARNGRKSLTFVENMDTVWDLKKILGHWKKVFSCNGAIMEDEEHGQVVQVQGDHRRDIAEWLVAEGIVRPNGYRIHGA